MILEKKAYAKINLGLDVTGKRDDGYHIVRMIMQNVDLYDTLTFEDNETGEICLTASSRNSSPFNGCLRPRYSKCSGRSVGKQV